MREVMNELDGQKKINRELRNLRKNEEKKKRKSSGGTQQMIVELERIKRKAQKTKSEFLRMDGKMKAE